MLSVSSEVMFRKNLEGSRTQGLGPPSNSISFEDPRVTKATEEGSTACCGEGLGKSAVTCRGGLALPPTCPCGGQTNPKSPVELGLLINTTARVCHHHPKAYAWSGQNWVLIYCQGAGGGKLILLFCKIMGKTLETIQSP